MSVTGPSTRQDSSRHTRSGRDTGGQLNRVSLQQYQRNQVFYLSHSIYLPAQSGFPLFQCLFIYVFMEGLNKKSIIFFIHIYYLVCVNINSWAAAQLAVNERNYGRCSECDTLFNCLMDLEHHKEALQHWSDEEEDEDEDDDDDSDLEYNCYYGK